MTGSVWIGSMRACATCFDADHVRVADHPGLCHVKGCRTADGGACAEDSLSRKQEDTMAGKGSDIGPLRQEDYQAMAERARVAEAELAKIKAKKPRNYNKILGRIGLLLVLAGAFALVAHFGAVAARAWRAGAQEHSSYLPVKRETTCYFTRHLGKKAKEPWLEDWRVYRSDCSGCDNNQIVDDTGYKMRFSSQNQAWDFIQKWSLEPCL